MNTAVTLGEQLLLFSLILAAGLLAGMLFDFGRGARKVLRLGKSILFLVDMLLCLPIAVVVYQIIYLFNQGEIRFFVYLSFMLGIVFYYYFYSRYLYKHILYTLKYMVKLWHKIGRFRARVEAAFRRLMGKTGKSGGD